MITPTPTVARRVLRALSAAAPTMAALLAVLLAGLLTAGPASAAPPEGWSDPDPVNGLRALVVYLIAPVATAAVVTLLALLPRLVGTAKATPALTDPAPEDGIDALLGSSDAPREIES